MGRKKGLVSILLCGVMLSTAGCGTKPYDLSSEEQEKVAAYAAHVVTRYNDRQDEGLIKIQQEDVSEETADSKEPQAETKDKQENTEDNTKNVTSDAEKPKAETVSLRQALKLEDGLDASFENYDVTDSYVESDYFAMNATAGKTFLAVHINLKATGGDVECDMLAKNLKYRVVINGDKTVAAQTSILLNDLGTYQGTIAGGSAQECVLLFETEKQNVENITSLQLKVSDGSTSTVSELQ
jgi:hypothetical protein